MNAEVELPARRSAGRLKARVQSAGLCLAKILLLAGLYFAAGEAGRPFAIAPGYASPVSPASGVALVGLLFFGPRYWPGVGLGSFGLHLVIGAALGEGSGIRHPWFLAAALGCGASLQALAGVWLIRRSVGWPSPLIRWRVIFRFLGLAGPLSCLIAPTVGITTLLAAGVLPAPGAAITWCTWWVGDILGIWVVGVVGLVAAGEPREIWRKRWRAVAVPLLASYVILAAVFWFVQRSERARFQSDFAERSQVQFGRLNFSLHAHETVLHGLISLFETAGEVRRDDFHIYARQMLKRAGGIETISWIPRVPAELRDEYEEAARKDGIEDFEFKDFTGGRTSRAGSRAEYLPIYYLEPVRAADSILGVDLAQRVSGMKGLNRARDTAREQASPPVMLFNGKERGVILSLPVYRRDPLESDDVAVRDPRAPLTEAVLAARRDRLRGYIDGVIGIDRMMRESLGPATREGFRIRVEDVTVPNEAALIFASGVVPIGEEGGAWSTLEEIGGRIWKVSFFPNLEETRRQSLFVWAMLAGALVFVGLLTSILLIITGGIVLVEQTVAERTAELKVLNAELTAEAEEREEASRRRSTLLAVTRALAEAGDLEEASAAILKAVCQNHVWDLGVVWRVEAEGAPLRCAALWAPDDRRYHGFVATTRQILFQRGSGLPGSIWAQGAPIWIPDLATAPNFPRAAVAGAADLHAAFGFPIAVGGQVQGIMEFFSHDVRPPDPAMLEMFSSIGAQIGQFMERRRAQNALFASEALLRQFIEHTPAAIAMLDTEMCYLRVSERWLKDYHLEEKDVIGRSHYEIFPDLPSHWRAVHKRVLGGAVEKCDEDLFPREDGRVDWLEWEARPWRRADGGIGGLIFYTQVITDRKRAEALLRDSEEQFRGAFEHSAIGMALVSLQGRWLRVNGALCNILGYTESELMLCTFQEITHPDDLDADLSKVQALLAGEEEHYQMEKRYFHKSGRTVWALLAVTMLRDEQGRPQRFVSQIENITDRKEAGVRIQSQLEEKEVLLREIHHRVKNNMQVISSLLQLQSGYLRDPGDVEIFKECQIRIQSMALVHDRLYRSGNLATIDFGEHLRDLTALLARGHSDAERNIAVSVRNSSVEVNLDSAIPLGLIAAELVTNAYKHAFNGRPSGRIIVQLHTDDAGRLLLAVEDDGVGLPSTFDFDRARSLGLRLIRTLARQIRAELSIHSTDAGSKISVSLPL